MIAWLEVLKPMVGAVYILVIVELEEKIVIWTMEAYLRIIIIRWPSSQLTDKCRPPCLYFP